VEFQLELGPAEKQELQELRGTLLNHGMLGYWEPFEGKFA
jgi:hypothetical protein